MPYKGRLYANLTVSFLPGFQIIGNFTKILNLNNSLECLFISNFFYGSTSQRMQNITAAYVLSRYATTKDIIELEWLPIKELFQWNTA